MLRDRFISFSEVVTRSIKVDGNDVTGKRIRSIDRDGKSARKRTTSEANFAVFHDLFYKKECRPLGEGGYDVTALCSVHLPHPKLQGHTVQYYEFMLPALETLLHSELWHSLPSTFYWEFLPDFCN